ncbi:MAG: hypothetical protein RLZZ31_1539 [Actinomycetota bacterium]
MRQVFPTLETDLDLVDIVNSDHRAARPDRPWIGVNMVTSLDGAVAVDGRSGGLSSEADKEMFRALRQMPDAIIVGAGTARAENYGPVRLSDDIQLARQQRSLSALPRLVVISGRLQFDASARLFEDETQRPILITTNERAENAPQSLHAVAEIIGCGVNNVDIEKAMKILREMNIGVALCEGGPTLNAELLNAQMIDEWFLTLSPVLVGGNEMRAIQGMNAQAIDLPLQRIIEADGMLMTRYARES